MGLLDYQEWQKQYQPSPEDQRQAGLNVLSGIGLGLLNAKKGRELQAIFGSPYGKDAKGNDIDSPGVGLLGGIESGKRYLGGLAEQHRKNQESSLKNYQNYLKINQVQQEQSDYEARQNYLKSLNPTTQALAGGGGPTPQNAAKLGEPVKFDPMKALSAGVAPKDIADLSKVFNPSGGMEIGKYNPGDYTPESFGKFLQTRNPMDLQRWFTPGYQMLRTENGVQAFDTKRGQVSPMSQNGSPIVAAQDSPTIQGNILGAKTAAKERTENLVQAQSNLPKLEQGAQDTLRQLSELESHPGMGNAVGLRIPGWSSIPGTESASFVNRLDQLKGGAFLQAFESLRGGGQITEAEGKKATDAIARMSTSSSEKEFKQAIKDYRDVVNKGLERARSKAGGQQSVYIETRTLQDGRKIGKKADGTLEFIK